jgi:hypothetical protein
MLGLRVRLKLPLAQHKLSGVVAHLCILAGLRAREDTERPSGSFAPVKLYRIRKARLADK